MDYTGFTREQLLGRIQDLEMLTRELLKEKEQETRLEYAWSGNLGHWYWNLKSNEVTFNPLKVTSLGYEISEIPEENTSGFTNCVIFPRSMDAMRNHLHGKTDVYEVVF